MFIGQAAWQVGDDAPVNRAIGDRLRDHYQAIIGERMPVRLLELLQQADEESLRRDRRRRPGITKRKRR